MTAVMVLFHRGTARGLGAGMTPWTAARQASLSFTISQSLLRWPLTCGDEERMMSLQAEALGAHTPRCWPPAQPSAGGAALGTLDARIPGG